MAEFKSRVFLVSMACTGNLYENAVMHSFLKIPKHEEVYLYQYGTFHDRLPGFLPYGYIPVLYERGIAYVYKKQNRY